MDTLLLRDERCLAHDPGPGHPERASRLEPILRSLEAQPPPGLRLGLAREARDAELLRIHSPAHLRRIAATAGEPVSRLDPDTLASPASHEAARLAAGAALQAVDAVLSGQARGAFALVRPPGHHAEAERAMGFCFFNNVAVAAAAALRDGGLRRVLVLDPDVHHGNGTQAAFEDRPEILFVSSHRFPFYPGSGRLEEIGRGPGAGFTVNLPLPAGAGDAAVLHLYRRVVEPLVDDWQPELILVSAGFDTWHADPLGGLSMTAAGYTALFRLFASWAARHCPGRIACVLEGGYDPAGVRAGVEAALGSLRDSASSEPASPEPGPEPGVEPGSEPGLEIRSVERRVRAVLAPHWSVLR